MKLNFVSEKLKLTGSVIGLLIYLSGLVVFNSSCAYKLSSKSDQLPGGVEKIFVPVFKNSSQDPGAEVFYTNAIKRELLNSSVVKLVDKESEADAVLIGRIVSIESTSDDAVIEAKDTKYLPGNTVLSTQVTVRVNVNLQLKKKGSSDVLWTSDFRQERNYTPPQLTLPVINSANNLYNLSARRQTLETLSKEMMQLAFDRMVDDF
ncbi:MAG: LPS assembly lipoprotein LptE [Pseudobdellovibrio sp.]